MLQRIHTTTEYQLGPLADVFYWRAFKWASLCCTSPYELWSISQIRITSSKVRLGIWWSNTLLSFAYTAFLVSTCIREYLNKGQGNVDNHNLYFPLLVLFSLIWSMGTAYTVLIITESGEIVAFYNGCFQWIQEGKLHFECLQSRRPSEGGWIRFLAKDTLGLYAGLLFIGFLYILPLFVGLQIFAPSFPAFLASFIGDPTLLMRILLSGPGFWLAAVLLGTILLLAIIPLGFIFLVPQILGDTKSMERAELALLIALYSQTQIMLAYVLHIYGPCVIPAMEWCLTGIVIYSVYGCITHGDGGISFTTMIQLMAACLGIVALMVVFTLLSKLYERSVELLRCWRGQERVFRNKFFRRRVRALMPLKFTVRDLYYVDRGLVLNILAIIFQNVINLLASS